MSSSAEIPDWSLEEPRRYWDPSRRLIRTIRHYQRLRGKSGPLAFISRKICVLRHRFWSVITQAEIDLNCEIGGGLRLPHPNGIVIHPKVKIGPNCLIFQQVTLGVAWSGNGVPVLKGHVVIGAGAKVLGGVTLGDHSVIAANAVVLKDVPERQAAGGVPAKPIPRPDKL